MSNHCSTCNNWIVRGANFCHHCGHAIAGNTTFETSFGGSSVQAGGVAPPSGRHRAPVSDHIWRVATLFLGGLCGHLFLDWDPGWIVYGPLGYVLLGPAAEFIGVLAGRLPAVEFSRDRQTKITIEHKETDNYGKRRMLLSELPDSITLAQLQHVAKMVLEPPEGECLPFARLKICTPGVFSQGDFYTLRDAWLKSHHALYLDPAAPNRGIILTERTRRLLKKSVRLMVVD